MEPILNALFTGKYLNCGHEKFKVAKQDKRVSQYPEDTVVIHSCEKIRVFQQRKGLVRFYEEVMPVDNLLLH